MPCPAASGEPERRARQLRWVVLRLWRHDCGRRRPVRRLSSGVRFGQLGLELVEKKGLDRFKARVYFSCGAAAIPWGRHVRSGHPVTSSWLGDRTGNRRPAVCSLCALQACRTVSSSRIHSQSVELEAESALELAKQTRFGGNGRRLCLATRFHSKPQGIDAEVRLAW